MKQKKKRLFGMHSLLAVIALMLAATIYASCSSEDDDYDNGWVELETMARGTRAGNGESVDSFISGPYFKEGEAEGDIHAYDRTDSITIHYSFDWQRGRYSDIHLENKKISLNDERIDKNKSISWSISNPSFENCHNIHFHYEVTVYFKDSTRHFFSGDTNTDDVLVEIDHL